MRQETDGGSTSPAFPDSLVEPLETALDEAEKWLVKNQPAEFREALLALYFQMHSFRRTAELYDERFVTIIENDPDVKVRQFCLDPSLLLRKTLARGKAAIGTTGRGIGPAYEDKVARRGLRLGDLFRRETFAARLGEVLDYHNFQLKNYYRVEPVDFQKTLDDALGWG